MKWIEVRATFPTAPVDWSLLISGLDELGCPNTQILDAPATLICCISDTPGHEMRLDSVKLTLQSSGASSITLRAIADEDWIENFKQYFKSRRVGKRFVIVPSWEVYEPKQDDLVITLDPGQAFGTGDHPTTRLCLELLERADVRGKIIADVGCGTGILSIGAILLGATKVEAVDIDTTSVVVAEENAQMNGVSFRTVVGDGLAALSPGPSETGTWDGVVSNIISATLISIAPDVAAEVVPGGFWIVSGIIQENWEDVLSAAEKVGFSLTERREENMWVAAWLHRN